MVLVHSNLLSNKCFPVLWRQRSNDITHCCWTGAQLQELDGLGLSVGSLWQSNETNPELLGIVLGLLPLSGVKGGESKSISLMVSKEEKGNPVHGFMRFCYLVICVSGWFAHCSLMFICPMLSVFAEILFLWFPLAHLSVILSSFPLPSGVQPFFFPLFVVLPFSTFITSSQWKNCAPAADVWCTWRVK